MSPNSSSGRKRNKSSFGGEFASARKKKVNIKDYDIISPKKDTLDNSARTKQRKYISCN
jgi:hypothetical protein